MHISVEMAVYAFFRNLFLNILTIARCHGRIMSSLILFYEDFMMVQNRLLESPYEVNRHRICISDIKNLDYNGQQICHRLK